MPERVVDPEVFPEPPVEAGAFWFLTDPDAFLRRFILKTILEPPRSVLRMRCFGVESSDRGTE
jgi:hypothetical protein